MKFKDYVSEGANIERELRSLVDGDYESLTGLSRKDFWHWASGLIDGLTKKIADKIYKEMLG